MRTATGGAGHPVERRDVPSTEVIDLPGPNALGHLIACPNCDALYTARRPAMGERATCARCNTVLIAPREQAFLRSVAMSVTVLILMAGALLLPFLRVRVSGFSNATSVVDAALAFVDGGVMIALSVAVGALIVGIPLLRAALTCYVLVPLIAGGAPAAGARGAFRLSEALRPWSMAEIFVIGCAVALVKVADLARIDFGPAFYMFGALVVVTTFQDLVMDRWAIWHALDPDGAAPDMPAGDLAAARAPVGLAAGPAE